MYKSGTNRKSCRALSPLDHKTNCPGTNKCTDLCTSLKVVVVMGVGGIGKSSTRFTSHIINDYGEQELTQCCGVIIENDGNNGHIVLTSAKLIRRPTKENVLEDNFAIDEEDVMEDNLADSLKVIIYLYDGGSYEGEVCTYDFHYNIVWIRFQFNSSLPTARLRQVDDYINVNPYEEHRRPHFSHFNFVPGHAIVVVGRYFAKPFDLMAAPGVFKLDR